MFITGQGGSDQAVRLIRSGTADYIAKAFEIGAFLKRLATIIRPRADQEMPPETGITLVAREVDRQVAEAAIRDTALLIRGAASLGKLRLARRVHDLADRKAVPMTVCNVLRDTISAEALQRAVMTVEEGSLVDVEIGQLETTAQDALMQALAAPQFRLIATLGGGDAQTLRADLMSVPRSHEIVVPPLADRPDDTVWLASRLFPCFNAGRKVPLAGIAAAAEEAIRTHYWPGNGRELRVRLMRAVEAATDDLVLTSDIFPERAVDGAMRSLAEVRAAAEPAQIVAALDRAGDAGPSSDKLVNLVDLKVNGPVHIGYPDADTPGMPLKLGTPVDCGAGPDGDILAYSERARTRTFQCPMPRQTSCSTAQAISAASTAKRAASRSGAMPRRTCRNSRCEWTTKPTSMRQARTC
jgi:DNA-binding NtrC family response regulator